MKRRHGRSMSLPLPSYENGMFPTRVLARQNSCLRTCMKDEYPPKVRIVRRYVTKYSFMQGMTFPVKANLTPCQWERLMRYRLAFTMANGSMNKNTGIERNP